jgi:hypothetical protein
VRVGEARFFRQGALDPHAQVVPRGLPVTGSLLAWRKPSCAGSHSEMTWFSRKPFVLSGLSSVRPQVPARLPMAFQVQTVSGFTPSISRSWHFKRPARLSTQTQSSSPSPISRALLRAM